MFAVFETELFFLELTNPTWFQSGIQSDEWWKLELPPVWSEGWNSAGGCTESFLLPQVACERPDTDPSTHIKALTVPEEKSNLEIVVTQLQLAEQKSSELRGTLAVTSAASNVLAPVSWQKQEALYSQRVCERSDCHLQFPKVTASHGPPTFASCIQQDLQNNAAPSEHCSRTSSLCVHSKKVGKFRQAFHEKAQREFVSFTSLGSDRRFGKLEEELGSPANYISPAPFCLPARVKITVLD